MAESVEKQVQDFVVGIDNFSTRFIKVLVWLAVSVVLFFASYSIITSYPTRIVEIDAMDYAQIAKNVSHGKGFTTSFIRPVSLRYSNSYENHPELTNPPFYSLYLSFILKLFDAPSVMKGELDQKIIIFGSGIFYILSIPLFLILAHRLVSNTVAYLSVFFYVTNILVLKQSISALPDTFLCFTFLLFLVALSYYDGQNMFQPVIIGMFLGICYLTRYSYGMFAFPLCFYFFIRARKFKIVHVVLFALTFLVVISPWLVRNYRITGNPFFTLEWFKYKMFSEPFPGNLIWRSYVESIFQIKFPVFFILRKLGTGINVNYIGLLSLLGTILTPFAIVSYFFMENKTRFDKLRWIILAFFAVQFIISSVFRPGANSFFPFVPFFIIAAVYLFIGLLDRKKLNPFLRLGIISLFILLNLAPTAFAFLPKLFNENRYRQPKLYWEDNVLEVAKSINKDAVIISDIPWATAWYGGITSIWVPWGDGDYKDMDTKIGPITGAYFTPSVMRYPQSENRIWVKFYSYVYRYNRAPEDNMFDWTARNIFKNGDIFVADDAIMKQDQSL